MNQQYATQLLELQQQNSQLQFQAQRQLSQQPSAQQHEHEIQTLERKLQYLETQNNANLHSVYQKLDDEKLKNERLQHRVRESKTKTQILAYS